MEAYHTRIKAEDRKQQLIERKARLRMLLDNEKKQFEVCHCVHIIYNTRYTHAHEPRTRGSVNFQVLATSEVRNMCRNVVQLVLRIQNSLAMQTPFMP